MQHKYTNSLIHESSPYLLQHAHNPVNWLPWSSETLEKAKLENKPLLISIGYAACHWCHVMEHESFEAIEIANIMNEHFICIKIDREERPDIDQVYMTAVQLMTGRGGWPLNCFATPQGKPFYGGTYFPQKQWKSILLQLADLYANDPAKVTEYADKLTRGVKDSDLISREDTIINFDLSMIKKGLDNWISAFDTKWGGNNQAPKFPLPNNLEFLLVYYYHSKNKTIKNQLLLSLQKMAYGGIFDQIGGGFSRYSVDEMWKVPHFEKMLYDNAQLIGLYSKAYRFSQNKLYAQVVKESIQFLVEELLDSSGAFYTALDADTEGVEGKYYVWTKLELENILGEDYSLAVSYFNVNDLGHWENGNFILMRYDDDSEIAAQFNLSSKELNQKITRIKEKLQIARKKRIKPALDDKSLTSWNALTLKSLVEAFLTFKQPEYLDLALKNAEFLLQTQSYEGHRLWHSYKLGKSSIKGFLEDYCFVIESLIKLYEATFNEDWLIKANGYMQTVIREFYDVSSGMFYFTSNDSKELIARKLEVSDNVIPASNSSIALSLFLLSKYFSKTEYYEMSRQMLTNIKPKLNEYLPGYSNWAILLLHFSNPFYEVIFTGKNLEGKMFEWNEQYLPNAVILGKNNGSTELELLQNKEQTAEEEYFVCENKVCQLPVTSLSSAIQQVQL